MYQSKPTSGRGRCPITGSKRWSYIGFEHDPDLIISYGTPQHKPPPQWVYVGDSESQAPMYRNTRKGNASSQCEAQALTIQPPTSENSIPTADISLKHRVYQALIDSCALTPSHRSHLIRRKLPFNRLNNLLNVGSMPLPRSRPKLALRLCEELGLTPEELLTVPGFFVNDKGHLSLGGAKGLMIPSFDGKGRIQGIQIRKDKMKEDESRYTWMSSAKHGGPSSGAPACFLGDRHQSTLWITEGTIKASALLFHDWAKAVIGMAGVGNKKSVLDLLPTLENPSEAIIIFDSDWNQKIGVLKGLASLIEALQDAQLPMQVLAWNPKWGKGIDDAIQNGLTQSDLFELPVEGLLRAAKSLSQSNPRLKQTSELPTWSPESTTPPTDKELKEATTQMIFDALRQPAGTFVSGAANTGSGKTYASIHNGLPFTLQIYRNYKALEEAEEQMRQKHGPGQVRVLYGRIAPPTNPNDRAAARRYERAGCLRYPEMKCRSERGHSPCEGCPLKPNLFRTNSEEETKETCPYWQQRLKTKNDPSPYLLAVPQSFVSNSTLLGLLPEELTRDMEKTEYHQLILDDCPEFISQLTRQRRISQHDILQWKNHPGLREPTEENQLLTQWLNALLLLFESEAFTPPISKELQGLSQTIAGWEKAVCEEAIEGQKLPLKAVKNLSLWLVRGGSVRIEGDEGKPRHLAFLEPATELLQRLKNMTVLSLDATPDEAMLKWFAHLTDMRFKAPVMKRRFPRIIQIPDVLWSREQVKNQKSLIHSLTEYIHDQGGIVLSFKNKEGEEKDHLALDGHYGHSERGLNCYSGTSVMGLIGHYALPLPELENQVWELRELAKVMNKPSPDLFIAGGFSPTRYYSDEWRPTSREMHLSEDPLVEHIRRYQHTSGVVQGAARPRNFDATIFLFSGEPLDGLPWKVPVELWTRQELNDRLELGLSKEELFGKAKELNETLKAQNEQARADALERCESQLPIVRQYVETSNALPAIRELRTLLAEGEGMVNQEWAYWVYDILVAEKRDREAEESLQNQGDQEPQIPFESLVPRCHLKDINTFKAVPGISDSNELECDELYESEGKNQSTCPIPTTIPALHAFEEQEDPDREQKGEIQSHPPELPWMPLTKTEQASIPPLAKVRMGLADYGEHNGWNRELIRQISEGYEVAKELLYRFIGVMPPLLE